MDLRARIALSSLVFSIRWVRDRLTILSFTELSSVELPSDSFPFSPSNISSITTSSCLSFIELASSNSYYYWVRPSSALTISIYWTSILYCSNFLIMSTMNPFPSPLCIAAVRLSYKKYLNPCPSCRWEPPSTMTSAESISEQESPLSTCMSLMELVRRERELRSCVVSVTMEYIMIEGNTQHA